MFSRLFLLLFLISDSHPIKRNLREDLFTCTPKWAEGPVLSVKGAKGAISGDSNSNVPMDNAQLRAVLLNWTEYPISLYAASDNCYLCEKFPILSHIDTFVSQYTLVDTADGFNFEIRYGNSTVYPFDYHFGEYGGYTLKIGIRGDSISDVNVIVDKNPVDSFIPIYIAIGVYIGIALVWIGIVKYYHRYQANKSALGINFEGADTKSEEISQTIQKNRVRALDAFRGISLAVMIFVNYGGGGYWFFDHSTWNGLTWADLVFPWFVFIMGTAIPLAFAGFLRRGVSRLELLKKVIRRSIILFGLGALLNNGYDLSQWRIPGVLQRFGVSYFFAGLIVLFVPEIPASISQARRYFSEDHDSLIETKGSSSSISNKKNIWDRLLEDIFPYLFQWIVIFLLIIAWIVLTFFGPVGEGCPKGYIGPGGIQLVNGKPMLNCTGGSAGFIDREIFGYNHIYPYPTCQTVYQTYSFDPEVFSDLLELIYVSGFLGNLTSIALCFLGVQSGRILLKYREHSSRIKRWLIWGIIFGSLGTLLCFARQNGGPIPINKNLWSLSFILVMAGTGNFMLIVCYFLIDVKDWWNGAPFVYLGMNSILMYCGHEILGQYFPFSWETTSDHLHLTLQSLIGMNVWLFIAYYAYLQDFFIAI